MKKSKKHIFKKKKDILKNIHKSENISKNKVSSAKNKYKEQQKPTKEYKESLKDQDRDGLISKLFFVETQLYYMEKLNDELTEENKKLKEKLEEVNDSE